MKPDNLAAIRAAFEMFKADYTGRLGDLFELGRAISRAEREEAIAEAQRLLGMTGEGAKNEGK